MGKEGLVGPVNDFGLLPELDTAVIVVAIYLGQREGLPIDLDRLSGGFLYLRQPHGCVVNEGSTEIVKGGELGIGHSVTSQISPARMPIGTTTCVYEWRTIGLYRQSHTMSKRHRQFIRAFPILIRGLLFPLTLACVML